jgi:hypothetical protein
MGAGMVELFGVTLTRRQVAERCGMLSQFAGVRLMTLGDGVERGVRMLEFRTGGGLRFTVLVDRAMDIGDCEYKGQAMGWHSPAGFRHPALHEYEGEDGLAWARSFSGLLVTCGLDHTLSPCEVPADNYNYAGRKSVRHSLHGRISTIPARLTGYGETWSSDRCVLWAEGVVQQSAVFGEDLHLIRRIEADVGENSIRISDRVVNHGFYRTPHMYFYHFNVGYPLLDEGSRLIAPINNVVWAAHDGAGYEAQQVGYRAFPAPRLEFREQVWQHELEPDPAGKASVAVVNERLALGLEIVIRTEQLPCLYEWQHFQAGQYALGVEPSTHHVLGDLAARERGEMIWLEHGAMREYDVALTILDGPRQLAQAEAVTRSVAAQPDEDYPRPTGAFAPLRGRRGLKQG